jgi:hypothetical protein
MRPPDERVYETLTTVAPQQLQAYAETGRRHFRGKQHQLHPLT